MSLHNLYLSLHRRGLTPFAYHTNEKGNVRYEHYKATAVHTSVLMMALMTASINYFGVNKIADIESSTWNNLDNRYHELAALTVLNVIALATGAVAGLIHKGLALLKMGPQGDLPHDKYNIGRLISPPTAKKTFSWIYSLGVLSMATYFTAKPEDFKQLAESDFTHFGALVIAGLATMATSAGLATGAHKARAALFNAFKGSIPPEAQLSADGEHQAKTL